MAVCEGSPREPVSGRLWQRHSSDSSAKRWKKIARLSSSVSLNQALSELRGTYAEGGHGPESGQ